MATEDADKGFLAELNPILSELQNANKAKRKKALGKLQNLSFESDIRADKEIQGRILEFSFRQLITCLSDQSEINRIKASEIIQQFAQQAIVKDGQLIYLIPAIHHRLATVPAVEESEDVRFIQVCVIQALLVQLQAQTIPYVNDVVSILKETIEDNSPEVRKASSECVSACAKATKEKFHTQSQSLVKPLLRALQHQRFKNRIACISALGDLLLYGDSTIIKDVSGPLAQCALDLPQVRLALVTVGGNLALSMPDRYSYWHHILPLLLFGLKDEDEDVRQRARELWKEVGCKYEEENMDQLKEEIDFDSPITDYPSGEVRPSPGCHSLVQRSMYHILPGLLTDLNDWQVGPRLQAAKLLSVLILNASSGVTQYAEKVLLALHRAVSDREASVVKQVLECGHYLGCFLPPNVYLPLVLPRLSEGTHGERPLMVLAALAKGTSDTKLQECLSEVITAVAAEDVVFVLREEHQEALLQLIKTLLNKCDLSQSSFEIFYILLCIASSCDNSNVAIEELDELSKNCGCQDMQELYNKHTGAVLESLLALSASWTERSPHFMVLMGLMKLAGRALGKEIDIFTKILSVCVSKKQDPVVSVCCLTRLRGLLLQDDQPLNSGGQLYAWLPTLVSKCMKELLVWRAGATAEALRTAAVACLEAACQVVVTDQQMVEAVRKCVVLLPALIEDDALETRLFSCKVVQCVATAYPSLMDADTLHTLADKLVKRLDDVGRPVRLKAAEVLVELFSKLPEGYDASLNTAHLHNLCQDALIFLDDPDDQLQESVSKWLEVMGHVCPDVLLKILEADAHKFRNVHICHKLLDSLKALQVT